MSRVPCHQCLLPNGPNSPINAVTMPTTSLTMHSPTELHAAQLNDSVNGPILHSKEAGKPPTASPADTLAYRRFTQLWNQPVVKGGLLYRLFAGPEDESSHLQLVVPEVFRPEVRELLHEGIPGGHLGHEKTFSHVQEGFYRPGYWNTTKYWCLIVKFNSQVTNSLKKSSFEHNKSWLSLSNNCSGPSWTLTWEPTEEQLCYGGWRLLYLVDGGHSTPQLRSLACC